MQEDNPAVKSERENSEAKTTWQGVKAWVGKHNMSFDTLKALHLAGLVLCDLFDAINV